MQNAYCTQYGFRAIIILIMEVSSVGKTSSAVKDRYNAKAYDEIKLRVPKGQKDIIKAHADSMGESVNAFIYRALETQMRIDKE